MRQGDQRSIEFELVSNVHSVFDALQACDAFLRLNGVSNSTHFRMVFLKLVEDTLCRGSQDEPEHRVLVCVERLTGETFRITMEDTNSHGEREQLDMRVVHASSLVCDQPGTLVAMTKGRTGETHG